jgi:hypothetical protein
MREAPADDNEPSREGIMHERPPFDGRKLA